MTQDEILKLAKESGFSIEYYMTNPPKPIQVKGSPEHLMYLANAIQSHGGGEAYAFEIVVNSNKLLHHIGKDGLIPEFNSSVKVNPLYLAPIDQSAMIAELEQRLAERDLRYRSCDAYVQELKATNTKLVEALRNFVKAGFGNSTDFYKQAEAHGTACLLITKAGE